MKSNFNMRRFSRLFLKHTTEHYKSYLMAITVLVGVLILGGGFMVYIAEIPIDRGLQTAFFMMIMLVAGTLFTCTIFADLGDRKKAIPWLTLPASHFEKFLVAWIYSFVLFILLYTLIFYLAVIFAINLRQFPERHNSLINVFDRRFLEAFAVYAFLHGIAIWGAVRFERLHFVKTAFVFFIAFGVIIFINKAFLGGLIGRPVEAAPFGDLRFSDSGHANMFMIVRRVNDVYLMCLALGLAIIFWTAAYFKVKEKQV